MHRLLEHILHQIRRRAVNRITTLMTRLYPDATERGMAYIAEGARVMDPALLGEGTPKWYAVVTPGDDGSYHIAVEELDDPEDDKEPEAWS